MPGNILTYLNYGLLGATIVIIVALVFFFFRGLARGWRYGTYRIVMFAIMFALAFATLKNLGQIFGTLNLDSFAIPDMSISWKNGEDTIIVNAHFTTLYETGASVIEQVFKAYNVNVDPVHLANYSMALVQSLLALILMMVDSLLISTLGNLFVMVLWHLIVKRFIRRDKRKALLKKGRFLAGLEELVIGTVCLAMFISPLTSVVNTLTSSLKGISNTEESSKTVNADNSTVKLIDDVITAYDESIFSQAFFNWTKNEKGQTFDVALTDFLTSVEFGNVSVSFLNELTSLTKSASYAIQGGLLSEKGFEKQNIGAFISSEFAPQLIRSIGSSSLITTVFPYIVAVATNIEPIANYIKTDAGLDIDFTFDYAKTFDQLASLYEVVVESGVIEEVLNDDLSVKKPEEFLTDEFVTNNRGVISSVIASLDEDSMHILDSIVEAAVFVQCANEAKAEKEEPGKYDNTFAVKDFMPDFELTDEDGNGVPDRVPASYKSIKWGESLAQIVDPVLDLMTIDPRVINLVLGATNQEEFDTDALIEITVDNYDAVLSVLCGEESTDTDTQQARRSSNGLLESPFVQRALGKGFTILGNQLNEKLELSDEFKIDLAAVFDQLKDNDIDKQTKNIISEFRHMFGVVTEFINTEAGSNFLKHLDEMPGIYFDKDDKFLGVDDDLLGSLSSALVKLDDSLIIREVMPKALGHFLSGEKSPISAMNLGDIHFNFNVDNIGEELSNLIVQFSNSQDLISYILSLGNISVEDPAKASRALSGLVKYSDNLLDFLLFVADSKIVNPEVDGKQNYNIAEILKTLLSSVFKDSASKIEEIVFSSDFDIDNELTSVVNLLVDIDRFDVVNLALGIDSSNLDLGSLVSIDFAQLFSNIDGSKLMATLMGDYLDDLLFKDGGPMFVEGVDVSFKNINSWSFEGNTINSLVRAANEIGDLSNIDFFNSDPYAVESIIKTLATSSLFDSPDGYQFSKYISGLLVSNIKKMGDSVSKLFADNDGVSFGTLEYSIESVTKEQWEDEAHLLSQMIRYLSPCKDIISDSNVNLREINLTAIENLLSSVSESRAFGSAIVPNMYNLVIDTIADSGMDAFKNANKDYIYTANKDELRYENRQLIKILEAAVDPVYGVIANDGAVKEIKISDVDAYYLVNPLLKSLAESHVFNSLSDKQIAEGVNMTALEKEFSSLLGSASLFESKTNADKAVLSVTKGVTSFEHRANLWDDEIDQVTNVLTSIQDLDIDLNNFSFDSIFPDGKDEAKRQKLENMLLSINNSQILHSVLPYQINKSVDTLADSLGSSFTLTNVNAYYTGFDSDGLANKYDDAEIVNFSYIIQDGLTMGELDMSSMHGDQIDTVMSLLKRIASSNVFNTIKEPISTYEMTAFENLYYQAIEQANVFDDINQLKASIFHVTNGARTDLSVLGSRAASWENEIDTLHQVFLDFDGLGFQIDNFDYNSLDESRDSELATLLDDVDKSITMHSMLPLKIEAAIDEVDDSLGEGVSLGVANTRYKGTSILSYGDGLTVEVPNAYDDYDECEHIARIVNRGLHMGSVDLSAGSTDTKFIDLLIEMGHSNVFNTLPDNNYGIDLTSLETVFSTSVKKSGIYSEKEAQASALLVTNKCSDLALRGDLWEEELAYVRATINALSEIDLDIEHFDLSALFTGGPEDETTRQKMVTLLDSLSDSKTLHSVAPIKLRTTIDSYKSSLAAGQVSFDNANYDYNGKVIYEFDDTSLGSVTLPNAYGYDENEALSYIIMESSNLPDQDLADLTSIDRTPYISLLKRLSASHVFNTLEEGLTHSPNLLTAFENTYVSILDEGNVYEHYADQELEVDRIATFEATKGVSNFDNIKAIWDDELDLVEQIITDYQTCGFTMTSINIANLFPASATEEEAELSRMNLQELMDDVNSSLTLHSTLHRTVNEAIDKVSDKMGGDSMDNANVYFTGYSVPDKKLGNYYTDEEVEKLSYIVKGCMRMPDVDKSDIGSIDASKVVDLLAHLATSQVFNSLKDGEPFTAFDNAYATLMSTDGLNDVYYHAPNPVDKDAIYSTSADKAKVVARSTWTPLTLSIDIDTYDVSNINGNTGSLQYVLEYFVDPSNSDVMDSLNGEFSSLTGDKIYDSLTRLNSCELTKDMVPNIIDKTIGDPSFSLGSINIKRANPFYCYNGLWGDKYDDDEIECIANIITANNNMKDSGGHSIFANLGSATITHSTVVELKNLMGAMNESQVFHLSGARSGAEFYDSTVAAWKEPLTAFEQILGTIYEESNLASLAYNSTRDAYASWSEKLSARMGHFRDGNLESLHGAVANRYEIEVEAICNLIDVAIDLDLLSSGLSLGSFELGSFSPEQVRSLSNALNNVDMVSDALPNKIDSFVKTTGVDKYNAVDVMGEKLDIANYFLSQEQMRDGAIDSIYTFSNSIYEPAEYDTLGNKTKDAKYTTFTGPDAVNMSEWILGEGKFSSILKFIDEPNGFYASSHYTATPLDGSSLAAINAATDTYDFTARDAFFYNISSFSVAGEVLNLGSYLGAGDSLLLDLKGSRDAFDHVEKTDASYLSEEMSIHSTMIDLGRVYVALDASSSLGTLPTHLAEFEMLASDLAYSSVESLFTYFGTNSSSLSGRYASGLLEDPVHKANSYINGNSYFTALFDATGLPYPSSYMDGASVRTRSSYDEGSTLSAYSIYSDNGSDLRSEDIKDAYMSMLRIVKEIGIGALTSSHTVDTVSLNSAFSTIDSLVSNPRVSALTKLFYLSSTYDYLLNRGAFHGEVLPFLSEIDVPNPFDSAFTYSGLSSFIA